VTTPEMISLPCPNCQAAVYRPLPWFRRSYGTCPHCGGGLAAGQFAELVDAIEQEFDARIEELLGSQGDEACTSGCCGRQRSPSSPREVGDDA
jgi:hypothetical protein